MKKLSLLVSALIISGISLKAQIFSMKETMVSFYSATPMENIEAKNKSVEGALRASDNLVKIKVHNIGFVFEKPLTQEHFHENYMETVKFPHAEFKGNFAEKVDWTKDGETAVTVKGKLKMHGVEKDVEIKGKIIIAGGKPSLDAKFKVKVSDYGIKVPSMVVANIAEVVDVSISAKLEPLAVTPKK